MRVPRARGLPVVGVDDSAGALHAIFQLLERMAVDTGMALVVVEHLEPEHETVKVAIILM
jgi:two-component system CheB/CheR fusion protein